MTSRCDSREALLPTAYDSIRQHTSAYVSIRFARDEPLRQPRGAPAADLSGYSVYLLYWYNSTKYGCKRGSAARRSCCGPQRVLSLRQYLYCCTSKAGKLSTCSCRGPLRVLSKLLLCFTGTKLHKILMQKRLVTAATAATRPCKILSLLALLVQKYKY